MCIELCIFMDLYPADTVPIPSSIAWYTIVSSTRYSVDTYLIHMHQVFDQYVSNTIRNTNLIPWLPRHFTIHCQYTFNTWCVNTNFNTNEYWTQYNVQCMCNTLLRNTHEDTNEILKSIHFSVALLYMTYMTYSTTPHDMQRRSIRYRYTANYVFKYKAAIKLIH